MSHTMKLGQTRPSTAVAFHDANEDFKQLKLEYVSAGKLTDNGGSNSGDGLIRTWTLVFSNVEEHGNFRAEAVCETYINERESYNSANGITGVITEE